MAKARAILKRLKAVKNIRKITRTMELIATARFKRAMDRATEAAAYTRKISELVADLAEAGGELDHPLLKPHETRENRILLVLTSNRGLCGGYNASVLRHVRREIDANRETDEKLQLEVSGKRGLNFMKFKKYTVDRSYTHFEDKPTFEEVDELAQRYIDEYCAGRLDALDVVYVRFESASRQTAIVETLLPLGKVAGELAEQTDASAGQSTGQSTVQYEFMPSPQEILEEVLPAAFKAKLLKCFLDSAVSEQISRMVAMKGATENAGDMISDLSQNYNRARQSQITSELSEIIGGAAALE
jgi:F-type H+-transporting ATPase subunit gamma